MLLEKCPYCTTDILYTGAETLVKCLGCGQTLMVAKFQSEQMKLRQAQQQNEAARMALAAAQQEKEESQQRLNAALMELGAIQSNQLDEQEALRSLAEGQQASGETLASMQALLQGLRMGQGAQQDGLSSVLSAVLTSGDSAEQKLANLQALTQKVLQAQNETGSALFQAMADVSQMLEKLRLDGAETSQAVQKFSAWFVSPARQEDTRRLQSVAEASRQLLRGQADISEKIAGLQKEAEQTRAAIQSFENKWEQSKLQELSALYHQAQDAQRERRFDQAAGTYRMVIQKGGPDSEVYWRLVLCHYCVEYQWDDKGQSIPTLLYPDLTPAGQLSVRRDLEGSLNTPEERQYYGEKLRQIDGILEKYRKIQHRVRCDVFISVKQSQHGGYTSDSDIASDLYDYIAGLGLSVFNSRRTPIPAGEEFEPYIIAALMSARVLMVVGTSGENMQSQWVRNEWLRFQWLQRHQQDKQNRRTLFCYLANGMRPEDIPGELNPNVQAIVSGIQAQERLRATLQHALPEHFQAMPAPAAPREPAAQESLEHIQDQMLVWLYTENFDLVTNKYKSLLQNGIHLSEAKLYLYALCAERKLPDIEALSLSAIDLAAETLFKLARRMSKKTEDKALLDSLLQQNQDARQQGTTENKDVAAFSEEKTRQLQRLVHCIQQVRQKRHFEQYLSLGTNPPGLSVISSKSRDWYQYAIVDDGIAPFIRIVKKSFEMKTTLQIPGQIEGLPVKEIAQEAFSGFRWLKSLQIPIGVMSIGKHAFFGCDYLAGISIPEGLVSIGEEAFYGCMSLAHIHIPESVKHIGQNAFQHCPLVIINGAFGSYAMEYAKSNALRFKVESNGLPDGHVSNKDLIVQANGDVYEGEVEKGLYHGYGKLVQINGDVYEGMWKDGMRDGQGKYTYAYGNEYEGTWHENKRNGHGQYVWKNGAVYLGDWKDDKRTGLGKYTLASGLVYEGRFENGIFKGQSESHPANSQVGEGGWKRQSSQSEAMHGIGQPPKKQMTDASGNVYEGETKDGLYHGQGKLVWKNGDVYEGTWQNGQRAGQGKLTWADGRVFDGEWKDDRRHGQGTYTFAGGVVISGQWVNGVYQEKRW